MKAICFLRSKGYSSAEIDEMSPELFDATLIHLGEIEGGTFNRITMSWEKPK
jgi:hypothetical protein